MSYPEPGDAVRYSEPKRYQLSYSGPVSVYCEPGWDWKVGLCNLYLSIVQHVKLSEQIRPWDTLACCGDVKQPTNKQTKLPVAPNHQLPVEGRVFGWHWDSRSESDLDSDSDSNFVSNSDSRLKSYWFLTQKTQTQSSNSVRSQGHTSLWTSLKLCIGLWFRVWLREDIEELIPRPLPRGPDQWPQTPTPPTVPGVDVAETETQTQIQTFIQIQTQILPQIRLYLKFLFRLRRLKFKLKTQTQTLILIQIQI